MGKPSRIMLGLLALGTVVGVGLTQFGTSNSQMNQAVVAHAAKTVNAKKIRGWLQTVKRIMHPFTAHY